MALKKCLLIAAAITVPAGFSMAGEAAKSKMKIKEACKSDIETLCTDTKKGKGKRARCLRENEAKLSPDCAKAVAKKPEKWGRETPENKAAEKASAADKPAEKASAADKPAEEASPAAKPAEESSSAAAPAEESSKE